MVNILITGASRGIGRATAKLLSESHQVYAIARSKTELEKLAQEVEAASGNLEFLCGDLLDPHFISQIHAWLKSKNISIDMLINNAAMVISQSLDQTTAKDWDQMLMLNLKMPHLLSQSFWPVWKIKKKALIINIASVAGIYGVSKFKGLGAYAASKAGLIALTEMLAQEGQPHNISAVCISPAGVATQMLAGLIGEQSAMQAEIKPENIAQLISRLVENFPEKLNGKNIPVWSAEDAVKLRI